MKMKFHTQLLEVSLHWRIPHRSDYIILVVGILCRCIPWIWKQRQVSSVGSRRGYSRCKGSRSVHHRCWKPIKEVVQPLVPQGTSAASRDLLYWKWRQRAPKPVKTEWHKTYVCLATCCFAHKLRTSCYIFFIVHIFKKYHAGMKFKSITEQKRWKGILSKLNAHIRYKRSKIKKEVSDN